MTLKNSKFLRFFTILVFCLELLAPIFLSAQEDSQDDGTTRISLREASGAFAVFATFLSEEVSGEEERDGKEHSRIFLFLTEFTFFLVHELSVTMEKISSPGGFSSNVSSLTSLFTLYRVFRI